MEEVALSSLQAGGPNRSTCEPLPPASCFKAGSPCCIAPPVLHGCARTRPPTFETMLMQLRVKSNIVFSLKDDKTKMSTGTREYLKSFRARKSLGVICIEAIKLEPGVKLQLVESYYSLSQVRFVKS